MSFEEKRLFVQGLLTEEIQRASEGSSKHSISELEWILKNVQAMRHARNIQPCYTRTITDQWDLHDPLGLALPELAQLFDKGNK